GARTEAGGVALVGANSAGGASHGEDATGIPVAGGAGCPGRVSQSYAWGLGSRSSTSADGGGSGRNRLGTGIGQSAAGEGAPLADGADVSRVGEAICAMVESADPMGDRSR